MKTIQKRKELLIVHKYKIVFNVVNQLLKIKDRVKLFTIYILKFVKNNKNFDLIRGKYKKIF